MAYFWANRSVDFLNTIYSTVVDTSYFDYDGHGNPQGVLWTYANDMVAGLDGHGIDASGTTGTIDIYVAWDSSYDTVEAYGVNGMNLPVSTAIHAASSGNLWPTVFAGNDTFSGSNAADRLLGYGGNDTLSGNAGNDYLYGNNGNDVVNGGIGSDGLYGDAGNDRVYGTGGNDSLYGGDGADGLNGGPATTASSVARGSTSLPAVQVTTPSSSTPRAHPPTGMSSLTSTMRPTRFRSRTPCSRASAQASMRCPAACSGWVPRRSMGTTS